MRKLRNLFVEIVSKIREWTVEFEAAIYGI